MVAASAQTTRSQRRQALIAGCLHSATMRPAGIDPSLRQRCRDAVITNLGVLAR